MLGRHFPNVEGMLREAGDDITAFADFPVSHCEKIWLTNPPRARQQRDQTPHRRCRGVLEPDRADAPSRFDPDRNPRRMASHRSPIPVRRTHVPTQRPDDQNQQREDKHRTHCVMIQPATLRSRSRTAPVTSHGGTSPWSHHAYRW